MKIILKSSKYSQEAVVLGRNYLKFGLVVFLQTILKPVIDSKAILNFRDIGS